MRHVPHDDFSIDEKEIVSGEIESTNLLFQNRTPLLIITIHGEKYSYIVRKGGSVPGLNISDKVMISYSLRKQYKVITGLWKGPAVRNDAIATSTGSYFEVRFPVEKVRFKNIRTGWRTDNVIDFSYCLYFEMLVDELIFEHFNSRHPTYEKLVDPVKIFEWDMGFPQNRHHVLPRDVLSKLYFPPAEIESFAATWFEYCLFFLSTFLAKVSFNCKIPWTRFLEVLCHDDAEFRSNASRVRGCTFSDGVYTVDPSSFLEHLLREMMLHMLKNGGNMDIPDIRSKFFERVREIVEHVNRHENPVLDKDHRDHK